MVLLFVLAGIGILAIAYFLISGSDSEPVVSAPTDHPTTQPLDTILNDHAMAEPSATTTRGRSSTPSAPVNWGSGPTSTSTQIWNDKWVEFTENPQVCDGVLRFEGLAKDGASVSYGSNSSLPSVLYREAELAPRPGFVVNSVPPIAGFLKPLTGREFYPSLEPDDIVASVLRTSRDGEFELVADWPNWLPDPDRVALGIWGYRPDYGQDNIRLADVESCDERLSMR